MEEIGDRHDLAEVLNRLGDAFQATGESAAARSAWERAAAMLDELDHPDAEHIRGKLGVPTSANRS